MTTTERARAYLAHIPPAVSGQEGHNQTFIVACVLVQGFALTITEALPLLAEWNLTCVPPWTERELLHKLTDAERNQGNKPRGYLLGVRATAPRPATPAPPKPAPAPPPQVMVERVLRGFHCTAADLIAASPCKLPPLIQGPHFHRQGAYLLDQLFEPGELVNIVLCGKPDGDKFKPDTGETFERNEWQTRLMEPIETGAGGAWVRMNPLDGQGVSDVNVVAHRFALVEIDKLPIGEQISLLAILIPCLPIAAIITSGGKSVHAWVRVDAASHDDYRKSVSDLLALLKPYGVDNKNKNPSRLSRLPGVARQVGATGDGQQRLLYLNPNPQQKPTLCH